jgi:dolichol-phosphate mannosyltransferase
MTAAPPAACPDKPLLPLAACGVLAWTLIRLALAGQTELIPEEAYYWTYSQHPSLSYFDHPPMVAWLIALGTAVLGDSELGVRLLAIALWPATAWLLFLSGRQWFGGAAAEWAVRLFCLSPIFVGVGFVITPDAPLLFFWTLTLYAVGKALDSGKTGFWLLAGLGLGGAMLSKYTAVMLAASLCLFLLLSARQRHWLARPGPWLGLALAAVVFSPVVIWNAQHEWASFLFQSTRTSVVRHDPLHEAGQFWLYQLFALTPFLLAAYAYVLGPAVRRGWLGREDGWNFALSFALPLFAVFVVASFKHKGHVNWTAPAYLAWSLAAAAWWVEFQAAKAGRRWLMALVLVPSLAVTGIAHASLAWGVPQAFALNNAGGWHALADRIGQARAELAQDTGQKAFVIGWDKLNIAAETGFYSQDPADAVNDYALGESGIGYRYWVDLRAFEGRPAVVVLNKIEIYSILLLKSYFAEVGEPVRVEVQGRGRQKREAYLVKCRAYHFRQPLNLKGEK